MTDRQVFSDDPYFLWLIGYRAVLATIALYAVLEKPFDTMLLALVVLSLLFWIGEAVHKYSIAYRQTQRRLAKEQEIREQRAAAARERLEAFKKAQEESAKAFAEFAREPRSAPDSTPAATEETVY